MNIELREKRTYVLRIGMADEEFDLVGSWEGFLKLSGPAGEMVVTADGLRVSFGELMTGGTDYTLVRCTDRLLRRLSRAADSSQED